MLLRNTKREETKLHKAAVAVIPSILLILYALVGVNQGVDLADTGYNIGTYRFMFTWDGYWTLAMLLANLLGYGLTRLPGGETLLGLNIYTSLLLGITAAAVYLLLKRKLPAWCVFLGEVIALGTCWCPATILYNYLTYYVILLAAGVLYLGLTREKNCWLVVAGVLLGINVFVRFSNLTEMAFILAVWYYAICLQKDREKTAQTGEKKGLGTYVQACVSPTLWCILGYAAGMALVLAGIAVTCGIPHYLQTVGNLFSMSDSSEGYSAASMVLDAWRDYLAQLSWILLMLAGILAGTLMFRLGGAKKGRGIKTLFYVIGLLLLLRIFWGRRILNTDYYSDGALWYFAVMFVVAAYVVNGICLFREKEDRNLQLLSAFSLITLFIAPLGTNNHAYATINNLFLVAPVTVYLLSYYSLQWVKAEGEEKNGTAKAWKQAAAFPVAAMTAFFLACLTWQTFAFQNCYVFGDSSSVEKRDTKIENNGILRGIYTTESKARNLEELSLFLENQDLQGKSLYLYGNIPALCYYLDQAPATSMLWPDLDSYEWEVFYRDLTALCGRTKGERPIFILSVERITQREPMIKKMQAIQDFLENENYENTFSNELFAVYQ